MQFQCTTEKSFFTECPILRFQMNICSMHSAELLKSKMGKLYFNCPKFISHVLWFLEQPMAHKSTIIREVDPQKLKING